MLNTVEYCWLLKHLIYGNKTTFSIKFPDLPKILNKKQYRYSAGKMCVDHTYRSISFENLTFTTVTFFAIIILLNVQPLTWCVQWLADGNNNLCYTMLLPGSELRVFWKERDKTVQVKMRAGKVNSKPISRVEMRSSYYYNHKYDVMGM